METMHNIGQLGKLVIEPGETYGSYLVLAPAEPENYQHRWRVRCTECGAEHVVRVSTLDAETGAGCKSCRRPPARQRADLTGQQYGPWLVVGGANDAPSGQRRVWVRDTRDGSESIIRLDKLKAKARRLEVVDRSATPVVDR